MPDPKDNAKQSGDQHPPEVEREDGGTAADRNDVEAVPGRGENQAGFVKDRDLAGGSGSQDR